MPKDTFLKFKHPLKDDLEGLMTISHGLDKTMSAISELLTLIPRNKMSEPTNQQLILIQGLYYFSVISYLRCFATGRKHRLNIEQIPGITISQQELHKALCKIRNQHMAHPVEDKHEGTYIGLLIPYGAKKPTHFRVMHSVFASDSPITLRQFFRLVKKVQKFVDSKVTTKGNELAQLFFGPKACWSKFSGSSPTLKWDRAKARRKSKDVKVQLVGVSAKCEVGRVAAKGLTRTGEKTRGKYGHEALLGHEFDVEGNLMHKERIIDRKNNSYKERVVNTDTGEVVRDVEQPLSKHTGHGSAKHKKQTT